MNSLVSPLAIQAAAPSETDVGHWQASLALSFQQTRAGTRLMRSRHQGPLYVQRPFYPEGPDLAHVYLLHPPGGLVSGDRLWINLDLKANTKVLCTTPGAGRLYRARDDKRLQEQCNLLQVAAGSSLEWFPQETLVYRGAHASMETRVELEADANFMGWEISVLGLPASGVAFDQGQYIQRLIISRNDKPVLIERLVIDGNDNQLLQSAAGLQGQAVNGIFVAGPFAATLSEEDLLELRNLLQPSSAAMTGLTMLGDFLVLRYLGSCSEEARKCFIRCWQYLRPLLLQREASKPRIWAT